MPALSIVMAFLFAMFAAWPQAASAETYPARPIKLIVPFAPGGGNDTVARTIGQRLAAILGQPVVVDNRAGAGGVLGAEVASKAPADGYTLFLGGVGSQVINPSLHAHLSYDAAKDFTPVVLLASAPLVLVVHPSVPAHSVKELIALARAKPGQLNYASNGNGSSSHLAALMFDSMAGVEMVHVPYKGLAPALTDLLSGQVQLMFSSVVAILPHIKSGNLNALGVSGSKRLSLMPDLPTIAEAGVPGYSTSSWYGILVPAGTPHDIVVRLNKEINVVLRDPDVRRVLANDGADPVGGTPEEFAAHINTETARLGKLVKDAKIQID